MKTTRNIVALLATSLLLLVSGWVSSSLADNQSTDTPAIQHSAGPASGTRMPSEVRVRITKPVVIPVVQPQPKPQSEPVSTVVQVTPVDLYHSAWKAAEENFLWRDRLTDWANWEHKFDGKLTTFDEAETAINQMLGTLKDGYTYYKDATVTADRAARSDERNVVTYRMLAGNIGYIKVRTFGSNYTASELKDAITALAKADSFIIDLRDNGGGLVHQAFQMFSLFVDEGLFTTLDGHYNGQAYKEELFVRKGGLEDIENGKTTKSDRMPNLVGKRPVAIIVNGNSASASEMFSGAIRDQANATLVGTKSFGKGIAQITVKLARGASVQVTFAEYVLPKGDHVHGKGITPSRLVNSTSGPTDPQLAEAVKAVKERMKP